MDPADSPGRTIAGGGPPALAGARHIGEVQVSDPAAARTLLPDFVAAFETLASAQEALSESIAEDISRSEASARATAETARTALLVTAAFALAAVVGLGLLVVRSVVSPVAQLQGRLRRLGDGDLSAPAPSWAGDELGDMGRALESTQASLRSTVRALGTNAQTLSAAAEEVSVTAQSIATLRGSADGAVTAVGGIGDVIDQIADFTTTIASAVEQQRATTVDMSRNVLEASKATTEIATNVSGVAAAAQTTSRGVQESQDASGELARMSSEMQSLAASFRC